MRSISYAAMLLSSIILAAFNPAKAQTSWSVQKPTPVSVSQNMNPVYIGGISSDMNNLATAANTTQSRALGLGVYYHTNFIIGSSGSGVAQVNGCSTPASVPTISTELANIEATFANAGSPMIELGMPVSYGASTALGVQQLIQCNYISAGINPQIALVNIAIQGTAAGAPVVANPTTYAQWTAYVDALRSYGILIVMPIISPNGANPAFDSINWTDTEYDLFRKMALYGGGMAFDSPPSEYLAWGSTVNGPYALWHENALAYAKLNNLPTVMILSAYSGGEPAFQADVAAWIQQITSLGNAPTSYVVENYTTDAGSPTPGNTLPTIGTETTSPSLTYTSLQIEKLLQNHVSNNGSNFGPNVSMQSAAVVNLAISTSATGPTIASASDASSNFATDQFVQNAIVSGINGLTANPTFTASGIFGGFGTRNVPASNVSLGWNVSGGQGEADIVTQGSVANGGFRVYQEGTDNTLTNAVATLILDKTGNLSVPGSMTQVGSINTGTASTTGLSTLTGGATIPVGGPLTVAGAETHTGTESHAGVLTYTGAETHSAAETHNAAAIFNYSGLPTNAPASSSIYSSQNISIITGKALYIGTSYFTCATATGCAIAQNTFRYVQQVQTAKTAAYTLVANDCGTVIPVNVTTAVNITVPATTLGTGCKIEIRQIGTAAVSLVNAVNEILNTNNAAGTAAVAGSATAGATVIPTIGQFTGLVLSTYAATTATVAVGNL